MLTTCTIYSIIVTLKKSKEHFYEKGIFNSYIYVARALYGSFEL